MGVGSVVVRNGSNNIFKVFTRKVKMTTEETCQKRVESSISLRKFGVLSNILR